MANPWFFARRCQPQPFSVGERIELVHVVGDKQAGCPPHDFERQPQIPRKVVHGAERQDAQWNIRAGKDRGGSPYASVSATNHDSVETGPVAFPAGGDLIFYSIGDPGAWHEGDRRVEIVRRAASGDPLPRSIDP
jgi:hypothetical protein